MTLLLLVLGPPFFFFYMAIVVRTCARIGCHLDGGSRREIVGWVGNEPIYRPGTGFFQWLFSYLGALAAFVALVWAGLAVATFVQDTPEERKVREESARSRQHSIVHENHEDWLRSFGATPEQIRQAKERRNPVNLRGVAADRWREMIP
ncbi:MAG: hypothetical protein FJ276_15565 [Planctomycetes bacterium]|nr:hypothetical protein [Planctomycetota bacterium]